MTFRDFPAGNVYNDPSLNFDELPAYIADQYYYHLQDSEITDSGGVLVDYYLEAVDSLGNVARSDIYHTYVGTGGGGSTPGDRVRWSPENPEGGDTVHIFYDLTVGPLPPNTNPVYIHIGHSGWQGIIAPDPAMVYNSSEAAWEYLYATPAQATSIDFVFRSGSNEWDNNSGQDWHVPVTPVAGGFVMDGQLDAGALQIAQSGGVTLWADWDGNELYFATESAVGSSFDRFLFLAAPPGALQAAPWAKAGQVSGWGAFLAQESSNGWRNWFDASGATGSAAGSILEGTCLLAGEFLSIPNRVYICAARYATGDGGQISAQAPAAVQQNGNVEANEWAVLALIPDSLTIRAESGNIHLTWRPVFGANGYAVYRAGTPEGAPTEVAVVAFTNYSEVLLAGNSFYFVRARF